MSLNDVLETIPRKTMVLFFLIDTSGSMGGSKIGAVNTAIEEVVPELKDISVSNADAQLKIAALEFNTCAKWLTGMQPVDIESFLWKYVEAGGNTALGDACIKLNEALSVKTFMQNAVGSFAPVIILLSDGEPTDDFNGSFEVLKKNNWFKAAIKAAVAIGNDANIECLAKFTGSIESVLEVHNTEGLKSLIKFVSVRASQVASKSVHISSVSASETVASTVKQNSLNEQLTQIREAITQDGADEW